MEGGAGEKRGEGGEEAGQNIKPSQLDTVAELEDLFEATDTYTSRLI